MPKEGFPKEGLEGGLGVSLWLFAKQWSASLGIIVVAAAAAAAAAAVLSSSTPLSAHCSHSLLCISLLLLFADLFADLFAEQRQVSNFCVCVLTVFPIVRGAAVKKRSLLREYDVGRVFPKGY
ncbi:hypothetical protein CFIO01_12362 [Colletotrichum fioriniae PJ7]|uniref:Uncharacterized protein n=1 Tax=Colletotrichum fioriniae PJ7 TaxID=1445577 RepID=A0A010S4A1_9PEZI|nr:hypothetical protein CFIO01_12362 [Colletotrichum fioriniae PJ7]